MGLAAYGAASGSGPAAGRRDRFALSAELLEQLADHRGQDGREHLVVVDEAQQLNRECIEFLRWLHDHRLTRFALLLPKSASRFPALRAVVVKRQHSPSLYR